jgi:Methylamine utilisation protein MauE
MQAVTRIACHFGQLLLVVAFSAAASYKLLRADVFRTAIREFAPRWVSTTPAIAGTLLWAIPLIEALVALLLIAPRTRRWAAGASLILVLGFSALVLRRYVEGQLTVCHCSWPELRWLSPTTEAGMLWRNGILLLASLVCLLTPTSVADARSPPSRPDLGGP